MTLNCYLSASVLYLLVECCIFYFLVAAQSKTLKRIKRKISPTPGDGYCLFHAVRQQLEDPKPDAKKLRALVLSQGYINAEKYAQFLDGGKVMYRSLLKQSKVGRAFHHLLEHMDLVFTILYDTIEQPIAVIRCNGDLDFYPKGSDPVTDDTIVVCQTSPCHYDATKPRSKYIQLSSFTLYSYNKLLKPLVCL